MSISKLINEILSEWAYRVDNGTPNPKNPLHIEVLSDVLSEMGMDNIKGELLESLTEADKQFTNPILNKEIPYKAKDGSTKKGIVGNLLRLPKDSEGRKAAEKMLPPDEKGREAAMKDLGSEKDGHSTTPQPKKEPTDKEGGEEGGQADAEAEKQKATQAMFQDPSYQSARLDAEKKAAEKLANSDPDKGEDGGTFGTDTKDEKENPKEETPGFKPVEPEEVTKEMPEADTSVFNQDSDIENISPQERHAISTKIDELSKLADEAKAKGEKAPNYNLCKVTVPGTNLYCDNNLGIPREDMPQFKGKPQPGSPADKMPKDKNGEVDTEEVFKKMLADKGIKTTDTEIPSDSLKASQSELVGAKVAGMAKALEADPLNKGITAPIYVSRDGYVIDGHHRWAAMTSKAIKDGKPANMKVHVIDMDAKDIIPMANKFAESIGVAAKKADANAETTPSHKDNEQQNKVIASRIQDKIKGWAQEEKDFFTKKIYKGNSPERRSWGEAIKAKGIGAWHAILKGAKHEVEEFKTAGGAVKSLVNGDKLDDHQKKALKAVGIKVATTALFGGLAGGLHHGASKFALHVAQELIPHTVSETIAKGIGKASLFAGAEEEDMYMEKFLDAISQKMAEQNITPEMMEQMVDSYNEKNDSKTNEDISYMKGLVTETVIDLINELMDEAEGFKAISNNSDRIVSFQTKQAMNAAIDSGSHRPVKATKPAPSKKEKPTGLAADKEYQAARGISPTQKTAPTGKLSSKMEDDDVFFPKKKVSEKQVEINTKIDSMPLNKESKTELKSIVTKILTGQDLNKHEKEFAGDWITIPATSEPKMYFATEAGNFANHNTQISFGTSMGEDSKQALYDFAETNEIFDKGHPVKKKSMVASQLTNNKGQKPRTKVKPVIKKSKDGIVESIKIGNTEMKRLPIPKYKDLLKQFTGKKPPMQNAEYEANLAIVALERHNAMLDDLATSGAGEIEIIDFGHDTSTSEGRKATIDTIKDMMYNKLYQDFKKYYKGEIPKEAKTVLYALKNLPNPYDNPKGNASETFQQNLDTIASMMNNNADFRAGVPDIQEIFDFMVKLGEGYAGFMPSASNWKVTDIVTYKATPDFKIKPGQSPAEVISQNIQQIKSTVLLEGGASVKYEKGGASAGYDKIMMTVYNEHKGFDTKKELLKLFEFYKWAFTPGKNEGNRYRSAAEVTAKEKELNDTLNRAVSVGILDESQKKKILAEGESQAKRMEAKVEKKVPFAKFKQCFGKTDKEQVSNYQTYKKQLGLWCKMGAVAEGINNNDMKYQLFSNLRTKYSKAKAGKVKPPVHEVIDGVSTLNGMGWSYDPGISATGKECKFISMNNANSSHINPIRRK